MAVASDQQRSSVRAGASCRRQCGPASVKTSPGRLMAISVTPGMARKAASGRNSSCPMASCASSSLGSKCIDASEIKVARDEDGGAVALVLVDGGLDVDGAFQDAF